MTSGIETAVWRVIGRSVRGAAHRRRGVGNQDAIRWSAAGESGVAVAVADGHGSAACFRSAEGAAMAVDAALETIEEFRLRFPEFQIEAAAEAAQSVPQKLVARWRAAVSAHASLHPWEGSNNSLWIPYGTTIIALLVTETYWMAVQLGDGDILTVSSAAEVLRPWPKDPRLMGVETTSLCGVEAESDTRVHLQALSAESPALLLLATDGYGNSFREDAGFLSIGRDLLEMIREGGVDDINRDLETWLNEASDLGSGDDITVALVCRAGEGSASDGN